MNRAREMLRFCKEMREAGEAGSLMRRFAQVIVNTLESDPSLTGDDMPFDVVCQFLRIAFEKEFTAAEKPDVVALMRRVADGLESNVALEQEWRRDVRDGNL